MLTTYIPAPSIPNPNVTPPLAYLQPKVQSALIRLEFTGKGPGVNQHALRRVLSSVFQQRRKMLRQSLKVNIFHAVVYTVAFAHHILLLSCAASHC